MEDVVRRNGGDAEKRGKERREGRNYLKMKKTDPPSEYPPHKNVKKKGYIKNSLKSFFFKKIKKDVMAEGGEKKKCSAKKETNKNEKKQDYKKITKKMRYKL